MTELTSFTVSDGTREVFCVEAGVSWGFACTDQSCARYVGWDGPGPVAGAAVFHLQWHLNGKPRCRHCDCDLAKPRARVCPRGECSVRDGGL